VNLPLGIRYDSLPAWENTEIFKLLHYESFFKRMYLDNYLQAPLEEGEPGFEDAMEDDVYIPKNLFVEYAQKRLSADFQDQFIDLFNFRFLRENYSQTLLGQYCYNFYYRHFSQIFDYRLQFLNLLDLPLDVSRFPFLRYLFVEEKNLFSHHLYDSFSS
jgi:hypothetical protein